MRVLLKFWPFATGTIVWLALFVFCLAVIGPGLSGSGPLAQEQSSSMDVQRMQLGPGRAMMKLPTPPGTTFSNAQMRCVPGTSGSSCPEQLVLDYTDASGGNHEIIIDHPTELMNSGVEVVK